MDKHSIGESFNILLSKLLVELNKNKMKSTLHLTVVQHFYEIKTIGSQVRFERLSEIKNRKSTDSECQKPS